MGMKLISKAETIPQPTRRQERQWIAELRAREAQLKVEAAQRHGSATSAAGAAYVWRGLTAYWNALGEVEGPNVNHVFAVTWERQWQAIMRAPVEGAADLEAKIRALLEEILDNQCGRQDTHTRALAKIAADARSLSATH